MKSHLHELTIPESAASTGAIATWNSLFTDPAMLRRRKVSVAHHEAGHIFAGHHFGFPLQEPAAELTEHESSLGLTHFCGEDVLFDGSSQARSRAEEAIVVLLAGQAAVSKLTKSYERGLGLSDGDREQAKRIIDAITPQLRDEDMSWHNNPYRWSGLGGESEQRCYLCLLEYRAERLVSKNWAVIARLAAALLRAGTLKAKEVHRIIAHA
jgi:ATP-dependent Zn protease